MDGTTATSPPSPGKADALDRWLGRADLLVLGGVIGLAAVAWWQLLRDERLCGIPTEPWQAADLGIAILMWSVMMVAMMLPSAAPMMMLYGRIQRHRSFVAIFVAGYVIVWTAWSALAATLQWAFQSTLLMTPHLRLESAALAGVFLVVAGLYQLTPWKNVCLVHCQSPLGFLAGHWRDGSAGALTMGLRHGSYCVGCCWALMGLLFVVGVMNLVWVAGLTGYVLLEKIVPGIAGSRLVGIALLAGGLWTALA